MEIRQGMWTALYTEDIPAKESSILFQIAQTFVDGDGQRSQIYYLDINFLWRLYCEMTWTVTTTTLTVARTV